MLWEFFDISRKMSYPFDYESYFEHRNVYGQNQKHNRNGGNAPILFTYLLYEIVLLYIIRVQNWLKLQLVSKQGDP